MLVSLSRRPVAVRSPSSESTGSGSHHPDVGGRDGFEGISSCEAHSPWLVQVDEGIEELIRDLRQCKEELPRCFL